MKDRNAVEGRRFGGLVKSMLAASVLLTAACDAQLPREGSQWQWRQASTPVAIGVGSTQAWVVGEQGRVQGWGQPWCDEQGCLAVGDIDPLVLADDALDIASNGEQVAVLLADGTVIGWGPGLASMQQPVTIDFGDAVAELALGVGFGCARPQTDSVKCVSLDPESSPAWVADAAFDQPAVAVAAGAHHACVILEGGAVHCADDDASAPTVVALAGPAVEIAAGGLHTCARIDSGHVQCWGDDDQGQLGHTSTGVGTVPLPEPVRAIATGAAHSCAVAETSGALHCWGSDQFGQLGLGTSLIEGIRRVDLGDHSAVAVASGPTAHTTFVQLQGGGLRGWGRADAGQTGYGDELLGTQPAVPGDLPDMPVLRIPDDE